MKYSIFIIFLIFSNLLISSELKSNQFNSNRLPDPIDDRAIGYLLKGKSKSAITNYGNFIHWDHHPAGLWGDYTYIPSLSLIVGVPGHSYSSNFSWVNSNENSDCPESNGNFVIWCSSDAYADPFNYDSNFSWYENSDTSYVDIVFQAENDYGDLGMKLDEENQFNGINQYYIDDLNNMILISLPNNNQVNPNNSNVYGEMNPKGVGFVYPWSKRPNYISSNDSGPVYDYGEDNIPWTNDDNYIYYGATVTESWFSRYPNSSNSDWQPSLDVNIFNDFLVPSDIFSSFNFLDFPHDNYGLLAHSDYQITWPINQGISQWPGKYASIYAPEETGCWPQQRWNDECWNEDYGQFISDSDVYMEFDDTYADKANLMLSQEDPPRGYPLGLRVIAQAHSYGIQIAEDILFFTMDIRNESGDNWCAFERERNGNKIYVTDSNGNLICGNAIELPDGSKINNGEGFNYKNVHLGFYMDADVVSTDLNGNFGVHTNSDDFMEYYDCKNPDIVPEGCDVFNGDTLSVSMTMIYDYDSYSGSANDVGIVATQILDSPYTTNLVDLNGDGLEDLYPGDKLKMTDWHWFDWYNRPGVVYREGSGGCCAGDPGALVAQNKEEIQYKVMSGDTTNLSTDEKNWFFHTATPSTDLPEDLNPHFDSLEGIMETSFFEDGPDGLDVVLQMSSGPFNLEVGEQVPFSFCVVYGEDKLDLINNAKIAQKLYNNHYQLLHDTGDINIDGEINVIDVVNLVNWIFDELPYNSVADLNSDGTINVVDIVTLVNSILSRD